MRGNVYQKRMDYRHTYIRVTDCHAKRDVTMYTVSRTTAAASVSAEVHTPAVSSRRGVKR